MSDFDFYVGSGVYVTDVQVNDVCPMCGEDNDAVDGTLDDRGSTVTWECEHCEALNETDYDRD